LNNSKVILFGSYAYGIPTTESDIDIVIVAPTLREPTTHREKMELYLHYNQLVKKYKSIIPIDLVVYTSFEYEKLLTMNSIFSKELENKGVLLYEADNKGVA
jgi:uncharacterized protein